jgi:hypothetical protein
MAGLVLVQLAVAVLIDEFGKEKNAAEVSQFTAHSFELVNYRKFFY